MDLQLSDKVYLVTGATSGLGLATARVLLDEGARVLVSARSAEGVDRAVAELGAGERVYGMTADNGDPDDAAGLIDTAVARWGRLDGVLVSVGGPPGGGVLDATDTQWHQAFDTVFLGAIRIARAAAAVMGEGGVLAFVLSSSLRQPIPNLALSNGLRPGLAMAAKTLADELGPRGIRVVNLVPGRIATPRTLAVDAASPDAEARTRAIPLGRLGEPAEFGRVAAFVLSPAASYLTGSAVTVDGGLIRSL